MKRVKLTERERDFLFSMCYSSNGATTTGYVITNKKNKFTDEEQMKLMEKLEE